MKILVAADGSVHTKRRLAFIAAHDEWLGPKHPYTVYEADAEPVFKPIRAFFKMHDATVTFVHRIGPPRPSIAKFAEQNKFALIVLGAQAHGAVGRLVMDSVATKVLSLCATQVALVRRQVPSCRSGPDPSR